MSADKKALGARLREAREATPYWSREELARRLRAAADPRELPDIPHVKSLASMIKQWERGDVRPSTRYRRLYARVLDTTEAHLFGPNVSVRRRDALALTGASGLVLPPARHAGPVAPELVDYFAAQLAGHYTADRHLGPRLLVPTVATQYELLCELAGAADGTLRPRLWALAAGYSAFLGWLHQDAGDIERSLYWHEVMIERAHRSLDPQLVGFALHNKAMLHADMLDGPGVVDLTRAALVHQSALIPKVRVLALQQLAHGTSLIGGPGARDECDRLLDEATALANRIDDPYPWGGATQTPHYLDVQRATCYVRLGLADEALALWGRLLPAFPAGARRDVGVFRARQAQALALLGEPEEAVRVAGQVVQLARETGSVRMWRELQGLQARMRPWADEEPGQELGAMLADTGGTT